MKRYKFTDEEIQLIKEKYANGEGLTTIARELGLSTNKAVKRIVEKYNFKQKEERKVNIHIFDKIDTPDKAYWLGFINGDGYVSKYYLCIKLSSKDRDHLEKFAEFMNIDKSSIVDSMGQYNNPICYIYVSSKYFVDKLRQIGISSGKSNKEHVPVTLPYRFISDYLRGLFDADGCISGHTIDLSGSLENIYFLQTYYYIKYGIKKPSIFYRENVHRTYYSKKSYCQQILNDMYYPSVNMYLSRKFKLANEFIENGFV